MKSHITTIIIALIAGYLAGYQAQVRHSPSLVQTHSPHGENHSPETHSNPFQVTSQSENVLDTVQALQFKVEILQQQLNTLEDNQQKIQSQQKNKPQAITHKKNTRIIPNQKNLVASGINPDEANEILRRISQQDFRRLELQNLMQRATPSERREYSKELRALNKNKISLRSEMGDDAYDQYLYISDQNNRVKITSVMAGSPAEASGFQAEDVILSYDNKKILNWSDIRRATIEGEIGSYTSIEILRDGEQLSLTIPRGTLGVQLEATQIEPQ